MHCTCPAYDRKRTLGKRGPAGNLTQLEESVSAAASPSPPVNQIEGTVLCIPGLGLLDETVAMPFAQLLDREGIPAEAKETETLSISKLFSLETKDVALICLCYLEHATSAQFTLHVASFAPKGSRCANSGLHIQRSRANPRWRSATASGERGVPARLFV